MFDLNLLPLNFTDGQEQPNMPELYATDSPRRTARGRSGDQLVILLNLQGSAPLSPTSQKQLFERLSQTFYQTSGSVTSGLKAISEALNQYLLDRNLHITSAGRQALGLANLVVVHNNQIILAQCGPTHAFILSEKSVEHFSDPQLAGRGLGLNRTPAIRFYQTDAAAGKYLILCPEPPVQWNTSLTSVSGQTFETLHRRLFSSPQTNLSAVLIQFQAGSGKINLLSSQSLTSTRDKALVEPGTPPVKTPSAAIRTPAGPEPGKTTLASSTPSPRPAAPMGGVSPKPLQTTASPGQTRTPAQTTPAKTNSPVPESVPPSSSQGPRQPAAPTPVSQIRPPVAAPNKTPVGPSAARGKQSAHSRPFPRPAKTTPSGEPLIQEMKRARQSSGVIRAIASIWIKLRSVIQAGLRFIQTTLARMMPAPTQPMQGLSITTMIFIAVAVPLIIVAVATVVYIKKGQGELYNSAFARAQAAANETLNQSDPLVIHNTWERTLNLLSTAEAYQTNDETKNLHTQAQTSIDAIDDVARLNFQNAIVGGLAKSVQVSRMVATANDLYMLDSGQGRVIRAVLTARGYEVDPTFICGPGKTGSLIINPLVSIAALPVNNPLKASIIGVDQNGNLLYCLPSGPAYAIQLAPPDNNWGKIASFVYDSDTLYVLDPVNNAIEVYTSKNGSFNDKPNLYFDNNVPNLRDAVDLAINGQDIYMLHADGHMSMCSSSQVVFVPTRCSDPAPYSDPRAGRDHTSNLISDGLFTQILFTAPPDPSIFLLSSNNASIFHFSLRLNLQRLLRPEPDNLSYLTTVKATAFTIGLNRNAFLAFGNQVVYASIP